MIDIKDLEAFLAIIDGGSISKAADDLDLTQPALSLKLKKMETELGARLFQRTPRNMIPLDAARAIEPKVRDILAKFDGVKEALATSIAEVKGQVRLGSVMGLFHALVVPAVVKVHERAPQLRLKLHVDQTENLVPLVAHGRLDMAIVAQPFESGDGLASEHLFDEELVLVGKNLPKIMKDADTEKLLLSRPWITMAMPDPLVNKYWAEQFNGKPFPWDKVSVPVVMDHILGLPKLIKQFPNAVSVLPFQVVEGLFDPQDYEASTTVPHRNGLHLVWRTEALELQRYRIVKDTIVEQAKVMSKNFREVFEP